MVKKTDIRQILLGGIVIFLVVPLQIPLSIGGVSRYISINGEDLLLFVVFSITVFQLCCFKRGVSVRWPKLSVLILALSAWLGLTAVYSVFFNSKLVGITSILWYLKWLEVCVFFLLIQDVVCSPEIARKLLKFFFTTSNFASVALAIWTFLTVLGQTRLNKLYYNPNALGVFLSIVAIVDIVILVMSYSKAEKFLAFIGLCSICSNIIMTASRTGLITAVTGLSTALVLIIIFKRSKGVVLVLPLFVVSLIIALAIIPKLSTRHISRWAEFGKPFISRDLGDFSEIRTLQIRLSLSTHRSAITSFKRSPILGEGYFYTGEIDNFYLSLLGETGMIGFVLFMSMIFMIFRIFWAQLGDSRDMVSVMGVAIIACFIVSSLAGRVMQVPRFQFLLFLFLSFSNSFRVKSRLS